MRALGYAEQRDGEVSLSRPGDGALPGDGTQPGGEARADGLLVSRLDFDVQVIDVPPVGEREMEGLLRYRLRSIYPGNPQDTAFDYRIVQNGHARRAVVFICQRKTLEKYKSAAGNVPLVLPYTLLSGLGKRRGDFLAWCCRRDWQEISVFRGGLPVSSTVQRRSAGEPFDLSQATDSVPEELRALPAVVVADPEELARIRQRFGDGLPDGLTLVSFTDLAEAAGKADGLFEPRRPTPALLRRSARTGFLAVAVALLGVLVFFKYVGSMENAYETVKRKHASLEREGRRVVAAQKEVDELRNELSRMKAREPADMYALLSELSAVLGGDAQILSMTVRERSFQAEALGKNPLKLMERFRTDEAFRDVRLSQVVPDARSGKERFSFSGGINAR